MVSGCFAQVAGALKWTQGRTTSAAMTTFYYSSKAGFRARGPTTLRPFEPPVTALAGSERVLQPTPLEHPKSDAVHTRPKHPHSRARLIADAVGVRGAAAIVFE